MHILACECCRHCEISEQVKGDRVGKRHREAAQLREYRKRVWRCRQELMRVVTSNANFWCLGYLPRGNLGVVMAEQAALFAGHLTVIATWEALVQSCHGWIARALAVGYPLEVRVLECPPTVSGGMVIQEGGAGYQAVGFHEPKLRVHALSDFEFRTALEAYWAASGTLEHDRMKELLIEDHQHRRVLLELNDPKRYEEDLFT